MLMSILPTFNTFNCLGFIYLHQHDQLSYRLRKCLYFISWNERNDCWLDEPVSRGHYVITLCGDSTDEMTQIRWSECDLYHVYDTTLQHCFIMYLQFIHCCFTFQMPENKMQRMIVLHQFTGCINRGRSEILLVNVPTLFKAMQVILRQKYHVLLRLLHPFCNIALRWMIYSFLLMKL